MYMVFLVLHDRKHTDAVLAEWTRVGVNGATLMDSVGAYRLRKRIPGRYAYTTASTEEINQSIFAIVPDEAMALNALAATEAVIDDLSRPETGVFSYWPLTSVKGISKTPQGGKGE